MSTPAEVGHVLQSVVPQLPLEEFVDVWRQEVTNLRRIKQLIEHLRPERESSSPVATVNSDLCVQQVKVLHRLFSAFLPSDLWFPALRTDELLDALLLDGGCEEPLEAALAQEAGAVCHGDDL